MVHTHNIVDTDVNFIIDPITRSITTGSSKLYLTQHDHNSERYTFQIPRIIEGHDIYECDNIVIDYTNTDKKKTSTKRGAFLVTEIEADDDNVYFTWLVSREATQLVGYMTFSVAFRCYDREGNIVYEWGTDKFSRITILEKTRYDQVIVPQYPDILAQIKNEALIGAISSVNGITADEDRNVTIDIPDTLSDLVNDMGYITLSDVPKGFSGSWNDLTDKPDIPEKVSDLVNDAGFITAKDIPEGFSGNYNDLTNKPTIPSKVTQLTNDAGYITSKDIPKGFSGSYNDLTNKPTIPSKVTQLTNDAGFITLSDVPKGFSGNYNDLTNKPTIPTKVSQLTNDSGYITAKEVPAGFSGNYNDLTNKPTKLTQFTNDAGFITAKDLPEVPDVTPAKIGEVSLPASAWTGENHLFSQVVSIDGVTECSQVDLTPSIEQLVVFYEKDISFVTENEDGVVTVYAIGQKPTNDYVIQVTITEVVL